MGDAFVAVVMVVVDAVGAGFHRVRGRAARGGEERIFL